MIGKYTTQFHQTFPIKVSGQNNISRQWREYSTWLGSLVGSLSSSTVSSEGSSISLPVFPEASSHLAASSALRARYLSRRALAYQNNS